MLVIWASPSFSKIYINMGEAKFNKSLIAIAPLNYESPSATSAYKKYGKDISSIITNNIQASGYFNIIPREAFVEDVSQLGVKPRSKNQKGFHWENWSLIEAEFLMLSQYKVENGQIHLQVYMYDVRLRKNIFQKMYKSSAQDRFSLAHFICNDIIKYLTNKPGIFLTKIAAIRSTKGHKKEIFIMDWNGSNKKQISFHRSISLSPSWSPKGLNLAYSAFVYRKKSRSRQAHIFIYDLLKKKAKALGSYYGTNLGSDFFPSGKDMVISAASSFGGLDIFKLSLKNNRSYPILLGPKGAINVEPDIHPNGRKIAFSSDRGGKVSLYEMDIYGEKIKKLISVGKYNSSPNWSPDGKYIAFSGYSKKRFDIFLYDVAKGVIARRLTSAKKSNGKWSNNEYPSFSPDGKKIVFSSDRFKYTQLFIVNADGTNLQQITFDKYDYKSPKWSPLIQEYIKL